MIGDRVEEFEDIVGIILKSKIVALPEDFTRRVMAKLPVCTEMTSSEKIRHLLLERYEFSLDPYKAMHGEASLSECVLYFFIIVFAHLILASVLFWGFRKFEIEDQTILWLKIQPQIVLFLTCWLAIAGLSLLVGKAGLKLSMLASLMYISIILFNGFLLIGLIDRPVFRVFVFGLVCATFLVGVFLVLITQKQLEKKDYKISIYDAL